MIFRSMKFVESSKINVRVTNPLSAETSTITASPNIACPKTVTFCLIFNLYPCVSFSTHVPSPAEIVPNWPYKLDVTKNNGLLPNYQCKIYFNIR